MSQGTECWRAVPGYEVIYEVSDLGRVRSLPHWRRSKGDSQAFHKGRILKPSPSGDYWQVTLSDDGQTESVHVHRLVAAAFIGRCPPGQVVRHKDGNGRNNLLTNLIYGTDGDNMRDQVRHGRHRNARKTHCPQGHEYADSNIYWDAGSRKCRTCVRERQRVRYAPVSTGI